MKTLLFKFIPGIALVAVALLAFAAGNAKAENKQAVSGQPSAVSVEQPRPMAPEPAPDRETPPRVVYVVVREADVIRWAPAYYGAQCYAAPVSCDPFTEVRVNPIPYPPNYCAPSLFSVIGERRHFERRR